MLLGKTFPSFRLVRYFNGTMGLCPIQLEEYFYVLDEDVVWKDEAMTTMMIVFRSFLFTS